MKALRRTLAKLALAKARADIDSAHAFRRGAIMQARSAGLTWREIGSELGMSPSGASSLVETPKPKPDRRPGPVVRSSEETGS